MSKTVKWILIAAGVLTVALIAMSKMGVFGKEEGMKVTAEQAKLRNIIEVVNASGKIYPVVEVKVTPEISGTVTGLQVKEGDTVKRGQVLARIYAEQYQIQRNQAASGVAQSQAQVGNAQAQLGSLQAQLDQARKAFDMQKKLYDEKVISLAEFNTAEANYKAARANYNAGAASIRSSQASVASARAGLARANTDVARTTITAPMDGVVSLLNIKDGEGVAGNAFNVGTEILRIADMDQIEVRVDVGENDIPKVKIGDSAIVSVDAYSDRKFRGQVTQIASSNVGASTSSLTAAAGSNDVAQYKVYIRLFKESYNDLLGKGSFPFRPGMNAYADIQTKHANNVTSVPVNAVTTREKPDSIRDKISSTNPMDELDIIVFVKDSAGTAQPRVVKTGIQDINNIEIVSGLEPGTEVITGPYDIVNKTLKKGTKVKVVPKADLYEAKKEKEKDS